MYKTISNHDIHHMSHIEYMKVLDIYGQYVKDLTNHYIYAMANMPNIRFGQYKGLDNIKDMKVWAI